MFQGDQGRSTVYGVVDFKDQRNAEMAVNFIENKYV